MDAFVFEKIIKIVLRNFVDLYCVFNGECGALKLLTDPRRDRYNNQQ